MAVLNLQDILFTCLIVYMCVHKLNNLPAPNTTGFIQKLGLYGDGWQCYPRILSTGHAIGVSGGPFMFKEHSSFDVQATHKSVRCCKSKAIMRSAFETHMHFRIHVSDGVSTWTKFDGLSITGILLYAKVSPLYNVLWE